MIGLDTGLELELLAPPGWTRLEVAADVGVRLGLRVESFVTMSKVPVPLADLGALDPKAGAAAATALLADVARHHGAAVHALAEDGRHFYLAHRGARLMGTDGLPLLLFVHDNSIDGGERVTEVVTRPFAGLEPVRLDPATPSRQPAPQRGGGAASARSGRKGAGQSAHGQIGPRGVFAAIEAVVSIPGVSLPPRAALHVHVDGRGFCDPTRLARLVALFSLWEPVLRRWLRTPSDLLAAKALPTELAPRLHQLAVAGAPWSAAQQALRELLAGRGHALNLYNLAVDEPGKRTVEFKLAAPSLSLPFIEAVRQVAVGFAALALDTERNAPVDDEAELLQALDPDGAARRGLGLR
ncbi:MAG: hypothetical protein HY903_17535 [Deltaproteobacteria bacterium]|nr:hypothetical protein [Deltaproteobacteria bacterium]